MCNIDDASISLGGAGHRVSTIPAHARALFSSLHFTSLLFSSLLVNAAARGTRRGGKKADSHEETGRSFDSPPVLFGERCAIGRSSCGCLARMQIPRRRFPG